MRVPLALLVLALLAGCLGAPGDGEFYFRGRFLATAEPADVQELGERVRAEGGEFVADGKTPPGFVAAQLTADACQLVRGFALHRPDIDRLSPCAPVGAAEAEESAVLGSHALGL